MKARTRSDVPDLHSQLESMLDQVWQSEADWRFWDRLDASLKFDALREQAENRRHDHDIDEAA